MQVDTWPQLPRSEATLKWSARFGAQEPGCVGVGGMTVLLLLCAKLGACVHLERSSSRSRVKLCCCAHSSHSGLTIGEAVLTMSMADVGSHGLWCGVLPGRDAGAVMLMECTCKAKSREDPPCIHWHETAKPEGALPAQRTGPNGAPEASCRGHARRLLSRVTAPPLL